MEKFWQRVKKTKTCWNWIGNLNPDGYGLFYINKKYILAHRFSYKLFNKTIPKNLEIDHLCKNRNCVNPKHLEAVTHKENVIRGNSFAGINSRKTHCKRGHPFNEENTRFLKNGRECITCKQLTDEKYRKKNQKKIQKYQQNYYVENIQVA